MGVNQRVGRPLGFNRRHMAGDALASRAARLMVRVLLQSGRARSIGRHRTVTLETKLIGGLAELRVIPRSMRVVAIEAGDSTPVHYALNEIIALHAILVRGAVGKVEEIGGRSERVFLQFPEILQPQADLVANGPVVIPGVDRIGERPAL